MERVDRAIGSARRRLALAVLLREGLLGVAIALCLAGSAALLLRRFAGWAPERAAWTGALLLIVPPLVWWRTRGRLPDRQAAATWLDLRSGGRGWLVTAAEHPDPAWSSAAEATIPEARPPIPLGRPLGALAVALPYCLLALWVPVSSPDAPPRVPGPAEALAAQRAALEELVQLPEDQELALEEALSSLEASDSRSESALEAAEALSGELDAAAAAADQAGQDAQRAMGAAGSDAAAGLAGAAAALGLDASSKASMPTPRLPEGLADALRQAAAQQTAGNALEAQAAQDLASTLSKTLDDLHTRLVEGRLVDTVAGARTDASQPGDGQPGDGDGQSGEMGQEGEQEVAAGQGQPGQGGASDGPGVAPLTFGDPSSADGATWKDHTLPAARYADLEHSELVGSGLAAPGVDAQGQGAGGAVSGDAAGDERQLSPSQRKAVSGFFGAPR